MHSHININPKIIVLSIFLGIILSFLEYSLIYQIADYTVQIIMNLLKFVSLPILFLSLTSTITNLENKETFKKIFNKTIKYTLLTTIIAAVIAMILYLIIDPAKSSIVSGQVITSGKENNIAKYLISFIPDNFIKIFAENNVIAVVISALMLGLSSLQLEEKKRQNLHNMLDSVFQLFISLATTIIRFLPYFLWSFVVLLVVDIKKGFAAESILYYIGVVVLANIIQATVILPIFLKMKSISPIATFKGMYPALVTAFLSKSSSATIPATMHCAENNLNISKKISSITIPLCTTINMNACAAFIYITVIFVSQSNGVLFTPTDYVMWIGLATLAAIGNAGVPMGCFFMASAFLTNLDVPIYLMGVILPFYTVLDMLETAINVWSDACVTKVVDEELKIV